MTDSIKKQTVKGTLWSTLERFSVQLIGFVVVIIMARILTPTAYSLVGMLTIFIDVAQSLVDAGFSQALIRTRDRKSVDESTVFYFNIGVSAALYILLFVCAPLVAGFYKEPLLVPLLRVISLSIIINSFAVVQRAILTVDMDFRTQAKASLTAAIIAGIAGIVMAYKGFGVWAIVYYQLINYAVNVALLWVFSKWRPRWEYSGKSFRQLFGFGSRLAVSSLIDVVFRDLYLVLIGRLFPVATLGYYTRAHQFASFPSSNLSGILQRVSYPVLCKLQDDDAALRTAYIKFLRMSAFVVFIPMMILLAVSKPMIIVLVTEKWLPAVPLLQILCLSMMWYPVQALNLNLLQTKGRSDLFLRLEIIKKIVFIGIVIAVTRFGLQAMCWGLVANSIIALFINTTYTGKLIGVNRLMHFRELLPIILYAFSTACIGLLTVWAIPNPLLQLIGGIFTSAVWIIVIGKCTGSREIREFTSILKSFGNHDR